MKDRDIWFLPNMRSSSPHPKRMILRARAKLSESDALNIYHCKTSVTSAAAISKLYCVSEKTVRDIWTGRTWSKVTWHLDESRPIPTKKMGRPLGRKDAQPRKSRSLRTIPKSSAKFQTPLKSQSIDIAPVFSLAMNEWPQVRKMDTEDVPSLACCWHDHSIDELLDEKTQCGFDTTFEDPFGSDWAGVLHSLQQSMRK